MFRDTDIITDNTYTHVNNGSQTCSWLDHIAMSDVLQASNPTINIGDLRIPLYATTHSQLLVRYRAINTWNGLSGDLPSSSSLCTFKNKLR